MSTWQVKLPLFEGPLDLLLFLVSRQEYDIMDLPMAEITESYLAAMDSIGVENLEDAGDFVLMAATLLSIKAKMMLPRPPLEVVAEIEDPRRELVQRLLLYQKTKEASEFLGRCETAMLERWDIGHQVIPATAIPSPEETLLAMTLYDLVHTMETVLLRKEERVVHQVKLYKTSLEERIRWVLDLLEKMTRFGLQRHLYQEMERAIWVISFLAILEMTKRQQIHLEQNAPFEEIYVSRALVHEPEPELEAA